MANVKELRIRIKSVGNIAKITKAMEMVASMKLRKVQAKALSFRSYTDEIRGLMSHLAGFIGEDVSMPLFRRRELGTSGILLISSDRGMCGAYNANMFATLRDHIDAVQATDPGRKFKFFCYGKKGFDYLSRRGFDVERVYSEPPLDSYEFSAARLISKDLVQAFESGVVDDVHIASTAFVTVARYQPQVLPFLPLTEVPEAQDEEAGAARTDLSYLLEPDPETIFDRLIERFLETVIYDSMLSSLASEHASRRMAMKGATDAARDMGKELKRIYNRARQENITKELLDIVGGASAVA